MNRAGKDQSSIRRFSPVGTITDCDNTLEAAVRKRLDSTNGGRNFHLTVFVQDDTVYATRASSPILFRLRPAQIVGVYKRSVQVGHIAEDIEAWKVA